MLNLNIRARFFPIAALVWLIAALLLFLLSLITFSLNDQQVWPSLNVQQAANVEPAPNTLILNIGGGGFYYNGERERLTNAEVDGFLRRFEDVAIIEDVSVLEMNRLFILLAEDANADSIVQALNIQEQASVEMLEGLYVTLSPGASTGPLFSEAASIRQALEVVPRQGDGGQDFIILLAERANAEALATRIRSVSGVDAVRATAVQRLIAVVPEETDLNALQALYVGVPEIEATRTEAFSRLQVIYREGANIGRVVDRITEELNRYFPVADLNIALWSPNVQASSNTVLRIRASDTGIPLYAYAIAFAVVEFALALAFRRRDDKLIRPLIRALGVFLLFWSIFGHEPFWDYLLAQLFPRNVQFTSVSSGARVVNFVGQHLELVIISSLITIPLGLMLGIMVTRAEFREFLPLVNTLVNIGQTIPTLAILAIMVPILRQTGFWPAVIALVAYGLLPIVRNTVVGIESVPEATIDAAKGMGMTPTQILIQIELPIASRVILAGVRTSMIINVGTATLGAFVGAGGLGFPIQSGISMINYPFVFLGAFPAALLAVLIDYVLGRVEYVITPRGLQIEQ